MLAGWICRVPVRFHTVAGLPLMESTGLKRWMLKITERMTYACAHRVFPNSAGLMRYILSEFNIPNKKFVVIGKGSSNGIDTDYFSTHADLKKQATEIRSQHAIAEDEIVFSFVGRIVKDKGIVELVQAFKEVSEVIKASLLLIGSFEHELDPLPTEVLTILKNDKRVILAGFQQDVRPWMMASDIFVFPSYREGFPNVVLQAACLEVPCIASDINGCNEIIQSGETGILVSPKDTEALYRAMLAWASNKQKRVSFAQSSREFVVKNFKQQEVWHELLRAYRGALEKVKL
jgi:glycosyltransferase involved in cell wall biosynthesis